MCNRSWFACSHAGQNARAARRLARSAIVFDGLAVCLPDDRYLPFREWIELIVREFKNMRRARGHAIAAAIAFVSVNCDEEFTRAVFVAKVCEHNPPFQISSFKVASLDLTGNL